jgi:predicted dinucleotide-binding enzyme
VFAVNQSTGRVGREQLSAFVAGDDAETKKTVMHLARDIGFDPIDAGSPKSARYLEPMAKLMMQLSFDMKMGTNIGYKLVKG